MLTDAYVAIRALEKLVHAIGPKRGAEDSSNGFGCFDVCSLCIYPSDALLFLLFLRDQLNQADADALVCCMQSCASLLIKCQRARLLLVCLHR